MWLTLVGCGGGDEPTAASTDTPDAGMSGAEMSGAGMTGAETPGAVAAPPSMYDGASGGDSSGGGMAASSGEQIAASSSGGMSGPSGHDMGGASGSSNSSAALGMESSSDSGEAAAMAESFPGSSSGYPGAEGSYPGSSGGYPGAEGDYPGSGGGYPNGGQNAGRAANVPSRPADFAQWSDEHFLTAIKERDGRVVAAVYAKGETSSGDPQFAQLMSDMLTELSGDAGSAGANGMQVPGEPGYPSGLGPGAGSNPGRPPVPPGGAQLDGIQRRLRDSSMIPVDSLDVMIGEALLAFLPQAEQAVKGAAGRLQLGVNAAGSGSSETPPGPAGMSGPGMSGPGMSGPGMSGPGMSGPGMSGPGMSGPGMSGPGMSGPGMSGPGTGEGYNPPAMEGNYGLGAGYGGQTGGGSTSVLSEYELVRAIVHGLVVNNTANAWQTLHGIIKGSVGTTLPSEENVRIVLEEAFSGESTNTEMAQQLLNSTLELTFANPTENAPSFVVLAGISQAPIDTYFQLGRPAAVAATQQGMVDGPGMQPGGPGMSGMGSQGPGSGLGMQGGPGMRPSGLDMGSQGGPGGGPGMRPGMEPGSGMSGGPGMEPGSGYDGDMAGYDGYGASPQEAQPTSITVGNSSFSKINVSPDAVSSAAIALWSPGTADSVSKVLADAGDLSSAVEALTLATNIPSDTVRRAVYDLFSRTYDQGANDLVSSGLLSTIGHDPGLLCVLKTLPRNRPRPESTTVDPTAATRESWVEATQQNVLALRDRLRGISGVAELAYTGAPAFRLHRGAIAEASIAVVAPGDAAALLGDSAASETKIYYSRVQVAPERPIQMQEIVEYYEKTSKGFKREYRAQGILWCDGVKRADGDEQSMDGIISQAGTAQGGGGEYPGSGGEGSGGYGPSGGGGGGGQLGQFTIETIVVVIRDPSSVQLDAKITTAEN